MKTISLVTGVAVLAALCVGQAQAFSLKERSLIDVAATAKFLVEYCPNQYALTKEGKKVVRSLEKSKAKHYGIAYATEAKGYDWLGGEDQERECATEMGFTFQNTKFKGVELVTRFIPPAPTGNKEYRYVSELCNNTPALCKKNPRRPGDFVSPKSMIDILKQPGMWDAKEELVEGWYCRNATNVCEGGEE